MKVTVIRSVYEMSNGRFAISTTCRAENGDEWGVVSGESFRDKKTALKVVAIRERKD